MYPRPTGLRPFRYHAWRGNLSGEEVRDGSHGDSRCGGNRCGIAPTAAPLRPPAGTLRGSGLYTVRGRAFRGTLPGARPSLWPPQCVARDLGWCDHVCPRWGGHTRCNGQLKRPVLGASASIMGRSSPLLGFGPSLCPGPLQSVTARVAGVVSHRKGVQQLRADNCQHDDLCMRTPEHNTRRYEHPTSGAPGPIGAGLYGAPAFSATPLVLVTTPWYYPTRR